MEWTTEHMAMPDAGHMHDGTWGCNGEYHWRAFSNGKDKHRAKYPNIDQRKRKWNTVSGSNSLYSFRAGPGKNLENIHELLVRFVPCYCAECRASPSSNDCPNLESAGAPWYVGMHEAAGRAPLRRTRATAAAAASSSEGLPSRSAIPKMQVAQLKRLLDTNGLETHGLKADLVERLLRHVATNEPTAKKRRVSTGADAAKSGSDSSDDNDDDDDGDLCDNDVWLPGRLSYLGCE